MFETSDPPTSTSISDKVGVLVELALTSEPGSEYGVRPSEESYPCPTLSNFCACPETAKVKFEPFAKLKSPFVITHSFNLNVLSPVTIKRSKVFILDPVLS